ncbi:MAG: glycoside hydrolase family 27 protein [Eubacterium sp.]|nr:glycoside hydrolase family 27 protein [Eubacterium sp.]
MNTNINTNINEIKSEVSLGSDQWLKNPPMGWNSYDYYDTTVTEEDVKANADYMAKHLRPFGWEYIVVDIAWYSKEAGHDRDKYQYKPFSKMEIDQFSRLLPDVDRFPSSKDGKGFGPLADYVHSLGLKFGIHIMRGIPRCAAYQRSAIKNTDAKANDIANPYSICAWNPYMYGVNPDVEGAQEYYDSLMELYAEWGVDFIKCDDICRMDAESSKKEIEMLHKAIEKCGRNIVLSLSPGPAIVEEHDFYKANANMWRITDDFWDKWELLLDMFDRCRKWQDYVTEGGYPDCDMLPIGMLGKGFGHEWKSNFSVNEQRTMLTLWSIFHSPLMIGCELTKLDPETLELLTNEDVCDMIRSVRGSREVYRDDQFIIWQGRTEDSNAENMPEENNPEEHETNYLALFNISDEDQDIPTKLLEDYIYHGSHAEDINGETIKEIWTGESYQTIKKIAAHGVVLLTY